MFEDLKVDINRYIVLRHKSWLFLLLTGQGLRAISEYRFSYWVRKHVHFIVVRQVLKLSSFLWHKLIQIATRISIASEAHIGKRLYIAHFGGIFVNDDVVMGENCNLSQGVTFGLGGRGENRGCPIIGDRVFIGPGAKLFGAIRVGNDVAVGANAVVIKDLPDQAVAVGIPATVISYLGSSDYIVFSAD